MENGFLSGWKVSIDLYEKNMHILLFLWNIQGHERKDSEHSVQH